MGEATNDLTYGGTYNSGNPDRYAVVPSNNDTGDTDDDQTVQAIEADIEHTRAELGQTLNAIQEKLNPQQLFDQAKTAATDVVDQAKEAVQETASKLIDQAKESVTETVDHAKQSVHDATIGKVENMVNNIGHTAQDAGSGIVDMIKQNPIPAALLGLGLGWFFLKKDNTPHNTYQGNGYNYTNPSYVNQSRQYPTQSSSQYRQYPTQSSSQYTSTGASWQGQSHYSNQSNGLPERLMDTVRQNPIPAAIAGLGLGYMFMQNQGQGQTSSRPTQPTSQFNRQSSQYTPQYWQQSGQYSGQQNIGQRAGNLADKAGDKIGDIAGGVGDTVSNVASNVGDTVGNVASTVGDTVGNVASTVGDTVGNVASGVGDAVSNVASGVGDTVSNVTNEMQYQVYRAQTNFERMLEEKPLMVGAMALSLGVAVGMLLPNTQKENQLMGEAREALMEKVAETAQHTLEKVQQVGEEVGHVAKNALDDIGTTAQIEAQSQGLIK